MHVLAGESALRALQAARFRDMTVPLPRLAVRRCRALLPGQDVPKTQPEFEEPWPTGASLEEEGFAFDLVESNAQVDLFALGDLGTFTAERPLELAVFDYAHRVRRKKCITRVLRRSLPETSLVRVTPHLYFVCPELIVLHMSARLDALELCQLIMELCGTYAFEPVGGEDRRCSYDVSPVTTLARIRHYAAQVRTRGGTATLRHALDLAMEGSASPAETRLALMMSLPAAMGGYGFAKPALNAMVTVPDQECGNVGGATYYLDAFWQDAYADLEYESIEFHLDPMAAEALVAARDHDPQVEAGVNEARRAYVKKGDADRRRARDLQYLGLSVIPVTGFDLQELRRVDQVARALARCHERALGVDMSDWATTLDDGAYRERRAALLQRLKQEH